MHDPTPPTESLDQRRHMAERHGLVQISAAEIAVMRADYAAKQRALAAEYAKGRDDYYEVYLRLIRQAARYRYSERDIRRLLFEYEGYTPAELSRFLRFEMEPIPPSGGGKPQRVHTQQAKSFMRHAKTGLRRKPKGKAWRSKQPLHRTILPDVFGNEDRLFFEVAAPESSVRHQIELRLRELGYRVLDYKDGLAVPDAGGPAERIGRVLKRYGAEEELEAFGQDGTRNTENLMVVFSRHPYDIARQATGRDWTNCSSWYWDENTKASWYARSAQLFRNGGLVAYLVRKSDPELHDPLARLALKPYARSELGGPYFNNPHFKAGERHLYLRDAVIGRNQEPLIHTADLFAELCVNHGLRGEFQQVYAIPYEDTPYLVAPEKVTRLERWQDGMDQSYLIPHIDDNYRF